MKKFSENRRQFLSKSIIAGTSLCLGCSHFLSPATGQNNKTNNLFQDKISGNSGMSYEQVSNFAFRNILIPQLKNISNQIGREKFIEMLRNASDEEWSKSEITKRFYASIPQEFMSNVLDLEVLEKSDNQRVYKITSCLWAKTFREDEAADIGYAMWCYGDYAIAKSENEKLHREKTLMQGHDCCLFKWTKL